jgi:hypothetical protein
MDNTDSKTDYRRFTQDIHGVLTLHITTLDNVKVLINPSSLTPAGREIVDKQYYDIINPMKSIEYAFNKFIKPISTTDFQEEISRQAYELFPDTMPDKNQLAYVKTKVIFEWLSSFLKITTKAWTDLDHLLKIFAAYPETKSIYDKIKNLYLSKINSLQEDTLGFLEKLKIHYHGSIVGSYKKDPENLSSNLIYDEKLNYDYAKLFTDSREIRQATATSADDILNQIKSSIIDKSKKDGSPEASTFSTSPTRALSNDEEFLHTDVIGTKDWNRKDAYILSVKFSDLKEEEKKFYGSSFVLLNPKENVNINLAAALVRQNSGYSFANKYSMMLQTLVEFAVDSLFSKDFVGVCDDTHTFLYHIGPIVLYHIIQDDLVRREFGYCYYVEKNSVIRLFPENIIKKHIIDYWADTFQNLESLQVDSYMNYSKGVQGIKNSYQFFFDQAAATRKRIHVETNTIEEYMRENAGKFFGYRRAKVYRRFIPDSIFGFMSEVNSTDLVKKFSKRG